MTIAVVESSRIGYANKTIYKKNLNNTENLRFDTAIFFILNWVFEHNSDISIKNWKICIFADKIIEHEIFLIAQVLQFLSNTTLYFEFNESENTWTLDLSYIKDNFREMFQISPEC